MRLGLRLPLPQSIIECDCGKTLDTDGYHLITCKTGGGPVWSHNSMISAWSECLKRVSLPHTIEPRDCYSSSQSRPDIAVHNATDFNVELDVSGSPVELRSNFTCSHNRWINSFKKGRREDREVQQRKAH